MQFVSPILQMELSETNIFLNNVKNILFSVSTASDVNLHWAAIQQMVRPIQ